MHTYQIWFVNEDVLLIHAEKAEATDRLVTFRAGDETVAAFSFEQILGFCNTDNIVGDEDTYEEE